MNTRMLCVGCKAKGCNAQHTNSLAEEINQAAAHFVRQNIRKCRLCGLAYCFDGICLLCASKDGICQECNREILPMPPVIIQQMLAHHREFRDRLEGAKHEYVMVVRRIAKLVRGYRDAIATVKALGCQNENAEYELAASRARTLAPDYATYMVRRTRLLNTIRHLSFVYQLQVQLVFTNMVNDWEVAKALIEKRPLV